MPRDKVCGDALIPDSLSLLEREGVLAEVEASGHRMDRARVFAPSGRSFTLRAPFVTVRREKLDAILFDAAARAGADARAGVRVERPLRDASDRVVGVVARTDAGAEIVVRAPLTILATGAASKMLDVFGVRHRSQPSALALRGYYEIPRLDERELLFSYERPVMPGYGWIFPMGDRVANVGVGVFLEDGKTPQNLRDLLDRFVASCPHVRDLLRDARVIDEVRGAPLRCGLEGARPFAGGLLVAGEALGTTYWLSGEGIGKAMETGLLAARSALEALSSGRTDAIALSRYFTAIEREGLPERFREYRAAQRWVGYAPMVNLVAWRAERSARVRGVLEAVLREERSPGEILSLRGLLRALVS